MNRKAIGTKGEDLAVEYLQKKGYQILERNWRFSRAEIDIIAKHGNTLVFVEVKTRTDDYFGEPASFVTYSQELMLADAATQYMQSINYDWIFRFDIVGVLLFEEYDSYEISHFEDAFFPPLK